jgi:hypothetical protein
MFSDSQASGGDSEWHGFQKQYAGPDFLIAGAGDGDVVHAAFAILHALGDTTAANIESRLLKYLDEEVTELARAQTEFVLVTTPSLGVGAVKTLARDRFTKFGAAADSKRSRGCLQRCLDQMSGPTSCKPARR